MDKDIQDVIAVYGQPRVAFQMEENRRDFQWVVNSNHTPSYVVSEGALLASRKQLEPVIDTQVITPMFNNKLIASECILTLMTRWDSDARRWTVTDSQKSVTGCE